MAKKIAWTDQGRDVRAIDRDTAMNILHGLARFAATEQGDLKRLQGIDRPSCASGSATTACDSMIAATPSRSSRSNTAGTPIAERIGRAVRPQSRKSVQPLTPQSTYLASNSRSAYPSIMYR